MTGKMVVDSRRLLIILQIEMESDHDALTTDIKNLTGVDVKACVNTAFDHLLKGTDLKHSSPKILYKTKNKNEWGFALLVTGTEFAFNTALEILGIELPTKMLFEASKRITFEAAVRNKRFRKLVCKTVKSQLMAKFQNCKNNIRLECRDLDDFLKLCSDDIESDD